MFIKSLCEFHVNFHVDFTWNAHEKFHGKSMYNYFQVNFINIWRFCKNVMLEPIVWWHRNISELSFRARKHPSREVSELWRKAPRSCDWYYDSLVYWNFLFALPHLCLGSFNGFVRRFYFKKSVDRLRNPTSYFLFLKHLTPSLASTYTYVRQNIVLIALQICLAFSL